MIWDLDFQLFYNILSDVYSVEMNSDSFFTIYSYIFFHENQTSAMIEPEICFINTNNKNASLA